MGDDYGAAGEGGGGGAAAAGEASGAAAPTAEEVGLQVLAEREALECIEGREGKDDVVLASIVDPSRTLPGAWAALPAGWNGAGAAAAGAPPANESQAAAVRALALALEKVRWLAFQAHHLSQPHRLWTLS